MATATAQAAFTPEYLLIQHPSQEEDAEYEIAYNGLNSFQVIYSGGLIGKGCNTECMEFYNRHYLIYQTSGLENSATLTYSISNSDGHQLFINAGDLYCSCGDERWKRRE